MKTLFLTAAALIFAAPAAFAADDHHGDGHPGGEPAAHAAHATHAAPTHTAHAAPAHTAAPAMTMGGPATKHSHHSMATTTAAPTGFPGAERKGHGNNNNRNNNNRNNTNGGNNSNRARGGNGTHVTINFNRHNVTASHHYHYRGGAYRGPSGYSYHRYSYGETFPSIYFARDYWIDDYSEYGLSDPPDGCVWVRYGDDAVLVDEDSGEILEVVYGQFY